MFYVPSKLILYKNVYETVPDKNNNEIRITINLYLLFKKSTFDHMQYHVFCLL